MEITPLDPAALHRNPAFHHGMVVRGDHDLVIVGGQNGTDGAGAIVEGGLGPQSAQALRNVLAVLADADADQSHVVRLAVYFVAGQDPAEGYAATREVWGDHPTAITGFQVAALARPDALVEVEAIAAVPR